MPQKTLALSVFIFMLLSTQVFAQKPQITWGEDFKMKKGTADVQVIRVDNSGIYVKESHYATRAYFVIGASMRESAALIKVDKAMNEI